MTNIKSQVETYQMILTNSFQNCHIKFYNIF